MNFFRDSLSEPVRTALHSYDDLTARLLAERSITDEAHAEAFFNPSYDTGLYDPFLLTDMGTAVERIARALRDGEHIAVWSDYDCDGIPGAVLLHDFFSALGASFETYIPHRHLEGYGVNRTGVETLASRGVTLMITVDSGTTDHDAIDYANVSGIDVIVTDHHLPAETLPHAYALVNPNARKDEPYPFKGLCGTGVAWKLVSALLACDATLRERIPEGYEKWLLDMAGLATVADMVPLVDENRILAAYGLVVLRKSKRLGLQKLCRLMRVNQKTLSEDDIAFMLAPRVNAASRMGDAYDAFALFTTADEEEADRLAKKLEALNRSRKAEAGAITRIARAKLQERAHTGNVIALGDPSWRPALLGLVAGTLAEEYAKPVFLWGREENDTLKGSVRSGGATHVLALMREAEDLFTVYGGHAAAGGFTVKDEQIFSLEERLNEAFGKIPAPEAPDTDARTTSASLVPEEATSVFMRKVERFAPFGVENPKPVFAFPDVVLEAVSWFGKNKEHAKIRFGSRTSPSALTAISFFTKGKTAEMLRTLKPGSAVSVLGTLERDPFTHTIRVRLVSLRLV